MEKQEIPEDVILKIRELEKENKILKEATTHWQQIDKTFRESLDQYRKLEQTLSEENARLNMAVKGSKLILWKWDCRTDKIGYNEDRCLLLGYRQDELPATFDGNVRLIHPDDLEPTMKRMKRHIAGETPDFEAEYRVKTKSGDYIWIYDRGTIVEKDILGNPLEICGIQLDISKKKRKEQEVIEAFEQADASSKAKSLFLASMSHEIYTPMAGVIGMAEILKQSTLTLEQTEYLDVIVKSANNLMSILNDILEFSTLESGKVDFRSKPFSIHQVVEEVADSFMEKAQLKNLDLITFEDPQIPREVMGDPARLRQILRIFTDNAIKYTDSGEVRLEADFLEWDDRAVTIRFSVSDTGIGIPEEGMKKLFNSFSKLDSAATKKYGGSGLGLAIAKRLIEQMNGKVKVESTPGSGTTFSFTAVFERYQDGEVADELRETVRDLKTLVIDPVESRRSVLRSYLLRWDAEVEDTSNPLAGLDRVRQQAQVRKPFGLVFLEYPQQDIDVLKIAESWKTDRLLKQSKLILTASALKPEIVNALNQAGIEAFILRPFTLGKLKNRIAEALSGDDSKTFRHEENIHLTEPQKKVLNILIAEDNLINQKVALVTLNKLGHHIDVAENGKIAVEMAGKKPYDLILMDIHMPEMDGLEATKMIRLVEAAHPENRPVHICAITANTTREDEDLCYAAGMDSYISKPFRLEELTKVLNLL